MNTRKAACTSPRGRGAAVAAAVTLAVCAASWAVTPAHAGSTIVCKTCIEANNDTTVTPGRSASPRELVSQAFDPPIAFIGSDHLLHVAMPATPGWQIETVDPASTPAGISMVTDTLGHPTVLYHDGAGALFVATRVAAGWQREPVDPAMIASGGTSITAVPGGIAIAFRNDLTGGIVYAERIGDTPWRAEVVDPAGATQAIDPSLVADGATRAISFYDRAQGRLEFAMRQTGGLWTLTTVDNQGNVGGYSSLIGGPSRGGFGIAYYDYTNADLKFAHQTGTGWLTEVVDGAATGSAVGRFCSAVAFYEPIDVKVGIAYYDEGSANLKFALGAPGAPGNWTLSTQASAGDVGRLASCVAVATPQDSFGIVYADVTHGDLVYDVHRGVLAAPVPSPARGSALGLEWRRDPGRNGGVVRFVMATAGAASVAIFDATGRRLAEPLRQVLPAGIAAVHWNGRDTNGRAVASGMYFARVETASTAGAVPALVLH